MISSLPHFPCPEDSANTVSRGTPSDPTQTTIRAEENDTNARCVRNDSFLHTWLNFNEPHPQKLLIPVNRGHFEKLFQLIYSVIVATEEAVGGVSEWLSTVQC